MTGDDVSYIGRLMEQSQNAISVGRFHDALLILQTIKEECIKNELHEFLCSTYSAIAEVYRQQGNRPLSIEMFKKSCETCREVLKEPSKIEYTPIKLIHANLRASLGNLADLFRDSKDFNTALSTYKEMELVAQSLNEMYWIQASLNNQGFIYFKFKDWENALKAFRKQEQICRKKGIIIELIRSLFFQALVFYKNKNDENFKLCFSEVKKICEENIECRIFSDKLKKLQSRNPIIRLLGQRGIDILK